jgi:hypothetical protein
MLALFECHTQVKYLQPDALSTTCERSPSRGRFLFWVDHVCVVEGDCSLLVELLSALHEHVLKFVGGYEYSKKIMSRGNAIGF